MKRLILSASLAPMLLGAVAVNADEGISLFNNLKANGEVRARYETVDDSVNEDADAMTVRWNIGLSADLAGIEGLSVKADAVAVQAIGGQNYNSTANGHTTYATIVDPVQTRMTQGYLQYKNGNTVLKAGRQIINLDNQRFVGSVDWRQMPQSFDSAVVVNNSIENLTLIGAYVWGINGIKDLPTIDSNSAVLNGSYKVNDMLKVTAYDYMLSSLHDTIGIALTGTVPVATAKIDYRAEYASQNDASLDTDGGVKNAKADASYYNLDVKANMNGFIAGVGYEFLSGASNANETAFQTPLATLHAFNGWADKFLTTPSIGLIDTSATLGYGAAGLGKVMVVYHDFESDVGNTDMGKEWDMMYTNAIPGVKGLNGLVKAAFYDGENYAADVTKFWLQLDYKF